MRHPVCNQQICENLFHYLPSSVSVIYRFVKICLHLITILRIYMIQPYLHSQNDVLFLFYFLINPAGTTDGTGIRMYKNKSSFLFKKKRLTREV